MNKVLLIGNVTKDPDVTTHGQNKKANFTIAVNRKYANAQGVKEADFINCVAWRERAEFVEKFVTKGKKLSVVGSIQTRSYDTQDGGKRFVTEVLVEELEFVTPKEKPVQADPVEVFGKDKVEEMTPAEDDPDLPF